MSVPAVNEIVALELMNMRQNNGTKRDDLLYEAAAFLKRRGHLVPAEAGFAVKDGSVVAPEGWQLVPNKMNADMINAWSGGLTVSSDENGYRTTFQEAWARVLATSPRSFLVSAPSVKDGALLRAEADELALSTSHAERDRAVAASGWRDMASAPKDGKHCILSIRDGAFFYSVQGAFQNGQWNVVYRDNVEPVAWMPNVLLPDKFLRTTPAQEASR